MPHLVRRLQDRPGVLYDGRRRQLDDEVTEVIVPMTGKTSIVEIELVRNLRPSFDSPAVSGRPLYFELGQESASGTRRPNSQTSPLY